VAGVADLTRKQDVVVMGSTSVVHALAAADAVDEHRLLIVPTALGTGERSFVAPVDLQSHQSRPWASRRLPCTAAALKPQNSGRKDWLPRLTARLLVDDLDLAVHAVFVVAG
jgi:dihydrofolate reductase